MSECCNCGIEQTKDNTGLKKTNKSGFRNRCKKCVNEYYHTRTTNKPKILGYYIQCSECKEFRHLTMTKIKALVGDMCNECKNEKSKEATRNRITKYCPKCDQELPITKFHTYINKDGELRHYGYCIECHNIYTKKTTNPETVKKYRASMHGKFRALIGAAKKRNLRVSISETDFTQLISSPCKYCGKLQENFNGIDRIDSNKGYTKENSVSCCAMCNKMKLDYPVDEFKNHINKIHQWQLERASTP